MWIFCCGMIRSGSTLQFQIAADLAEQHGLGRRIEYVPEAEFPVVEARYGKEPGLKIFKAHICIEPIQRLFASGQAKGIYSHRDIRDVAVSASRKFGLTVEQLLDKGWLDQAVHDCELWTRFPNTMVSRYDDLMSDLPKEVRRIAKHLGIDLSATEAEEVASRYTLDKQRQRVEKIASVHKQGGGLFDPHSLLHHNHIASGECGGWQKILTQRELEIVENRFADWMQAWGYSVSSPKKDMNEFAETFVPHLGWLAHEADDDVAIFLREGHFEAIEQAFFWLYLRPGNTFLDCGAHVGLFSVLAGHAMENQGRIVSLEPNPKTASLLKRNLQQHQISIAEIVEAAAWSSETRLKFASEAKGKAAYARIVKGPAPAQAEIEVAAVAVADVVKARGISRVDFAKIDTEGAEADVLAGAAPAISAGKLPLLMVEFTEQNLERSGESSKQLFDRLLQLGYTLHRFDPNSLQLVPAAYEGKIWYENLFATTEPQKVNEILRQAAPERIRIARDIIARGNASRKSFEAEDKARQAEARAQQAEQRAAGLDGVSEAQREHLNAASKTIDCLYEKLKTAKRHPWVKVGRKLGFVNRRIFDKVPSGGGKSSQAQAAEAPFGMEATLRHLVEKGVSPSVVLDIGAAKGYWSEFACHYFPKANFYLLEPLSANQPRLQELSAKVPRIKHLRCAAGDKPGEALINVTPDLDGSSLLSFNRERQPQDEMVQIVTVDSLLESRKIEPPQLVKMDVQGYELKTLEGGKKLFETAELFIMEVSFFRFMPECPLMHEVIHYMADRGFVVFDIAGFLRRPYQNDLGQADLVFVKKTSPLVSSNRWS